MHCHRVGVALVCCRALGQQQSLKEQLVGTWTAVSWEQEKSNGTKLQQFGTNPTGIAVFDAGGRYVMTYFGTYSVSEADRSIAIYIEGSSFPNWNGANQKRIVTITGDQLTLTVRPPNGESVDVVWKRAK